MDEFFKQDASLQYEIHAVEPSDGFREELEDWSNSVGGAVKAVKGTGESIPMENDSIDIVVIAQAFHWMANQSTLKELHRVMKPGTINFKPCLSLVLFVNSLLYDYHILYRVSASATVERVRS